MTRSAPRIEPYAYRCDPNVPVFDDVSPIIIFDGECVMCSAFARFVLRCDRARRFKLLAAQSPLGAALYDHFGLKRDEFETYVLLEAGAARVKSDASLRILGLLGPPWSFAVIGRIVPRSMRDAVYDYVARNRLRWFGSRATCYAPTPQEAERFLQ